MNASITAVPPLLPSVPKTDRALKLVIPLGFYDGYHGKSLDYLQQEYKVTGIYLAIGVHVDMPQHL